MTEAFQKCAVVLTACIQPKVVSGDSFRLDPKVRLNDYLIALDRWLTISDSRIDAIIFVENSCSDLSELMNLVKNRNIYDRKVEFLSFSESERPHSVHYGYSEMEILDYCIDNSKLINEYPVFIKATGRLFFSNLSKFVYYCSKNKFEFISDSRDYKFFNIEHHYVVTTLFAVNREFYKKKLYNMKSDLMNGKYTFMEEAYFAYLENEPNIKLRFPFNIDPIGFGAHANVNYSSINKKMFAFVRGVLRKMLPDLKI